MQKMILRVWPRNTMRVAYWRWQALEQRLAQARQGLEQQYLATRGQAEQGSAEAQEGILRRVRAMLDQPPDPRVLQPQGRLARAFTRGGQGFCRRAPEPVQVELRRLSDAVEKICRNYSELAARLRLSQEIIQVFAGNPEFCRAHYFRLALISPESARLLFHLRNQRLRNRRTIQDCLPENCPPPNLT
ncbi:MAG: hypothetical protein ACOZF2_13690 [Thermodesulfobacteriota bacterium]